MQSLIYNNKPIRVFEIHEGVTCFPWFCGRDVCEILEYSDYKQAINIHIDTENKSNLKILWGVFNTPHKFHYNEERMAYIDETGLYSLINRSRMPRKEPFKAFLDQFFYDLRYKSDLMDIFSFIKDKKVAIDINSAWFQELWYPISKRTHSLLTMRVLNWMGYGGEYFTQKQSFIKLLDRNNIPYEEITYTDPRFSGHEVMIKEIADTDTKIVKQKKWLVMEVRNFKKAVIRLNTKNGETVRDYYLNLEEVCFDYAEYQANWLAEKAELQRKISDAKLVDSMAKLAIKDKSEEELKRQVEEEKKRAEEEKKRAEEEKKRAERAEHEKDQEKIAREKAERKALNIKKFMNRVSLKESKDEWIYIGTTRLYAQERLFKIGSTRRLTSRIPQYNTGRAATDHFYYAWAMKCYNAKDVDYHIQKLLADFKFKDPESPEADKAKDNRVEMYHGIKFSDLKDILTFIVNNYDESIECVNRFIRNRLDSSLEEEDEIPPPLDLKRVTCTIGEHEEVVEVEDEKELKVLFKNIMRCLKDQQAREELLVVERKILLNELSPFMSTTKTKTLLWGKVKSLISWKSSNVDLELSNSDDEAAGPSRPAAATSPFKYRVKY
jgi:hypothetical protein